MIVTAAVATLALLLVHAGLVKLRRPAALRATLRSAGLPSGRAAPVAIGAVEVVVGTVALVRSHPAAGVALAVAYAVFAVFSWRQRRRGAGCGCFGEPTAEVSGAHLALDGAGVLTGVAAALTSAPAAATVLATAGVVPALTAALLAVTAVAGLQLLVTVLPEVARLSLRPGADA